MKKPPKPNQKHFETVDTETNHFESEITKERELRL